MVEVERCTIFGGSFNKKSNNYNEMEEANENRIFDIFEAKELKLH